MSLSVSMKCETAYSNIDKFLVKMIFTHVAINENSEYKFSEKYLKILFIEWQSIAILNMLLKLKL